MSRRILPIETQKLEWHQGLPYASDGKPLFVSVDDALADHERMLVQDSGLSARWQTWPVEITPTCVMAETHFGTGLNALVTWFHWLQNAPSGACLHYFTGTPHPLQRSDLEQILAFWPKLASLASSLLAVYPVLTPGYHQLVIEEGRIHLTLMLGDPAQSFHDLLYCGDEALERSLRLRCVDVWFLTGQPTPALRSVMDCLSGPDTVRIGHIPEGQPDHKKMAQRSTPWAVARSRSLREKKAIVLGAGLAGCFTAYSLVKRGWDVLLLDKGAELATGASGNPQAVIYPKLSAYHSPLTDFMLSAYLYANRWYNALLKTHPIGECRGILQLAYNEKEARSQRSLHDWLKAYPELGERVDAKRASVLAGLPVHSDALYLPLSGWMDIQALCIWLAQRKGIECVFDYPVGSLGYEDGRWTLGQFSTENLVLANGFSAKQFWQTQHLPLVPNAGQLTRIASTQDTSCLNIPLCGDGHILPQRDQQHIFGATYHPGRIAQVSHAHDDIINRKRLGTLAVDVNWPDQALGNWYGTRAATPDYLPIVGPAPDVEAFQQRFASLATDAKRWIPAPGEYYPGLYLCAGFGSRGLTSIPLCSDWLAAQMSQEMEYLPRRMVQSLSPARFLVKEISKGLIFP